MRNTIYTGILGCLLGASLGSACYVERDKVDHCANQDGDAYCMREYGAEAKFCSLGVCDEGKGDGCGSARPSSNACYSPCGEDRALEDDPSCEGLADGSSSSDTVSSVESTVDPSGEPTTEPTGSMTMSGSETESVTVTATDSGPTTGGACVTSDECTDPMNPICEDMACVPCTDAPVPDDACAEKGAGTPVCRDDGACVACTPANAGACGGTTPVCDGATNECEGCDFHEQCPESACRIETGACFDEAEVYDVGSGQTYASIEAAVADLGEGAEVVLRVHDGASYDGAVTIAGAGTAYALLADDDAMVPQWVNTMDAAPTLRVEDGAEVYVQSLTLTLNGNGANPGITADAGTLYLDRTSVVGNTGGGILLENAAAGHLRNCIIGGNGAGAGPTRGVTVDASSVEILYSTIARNDADTVDDSLSCNGGSSVAVRNSIMVGRDDPSVSCAGATIEDSALDQASGANTNVGAIQNTWFDNVAGNVFTLSAAGGGVFGDIARWADGDPSTDIDGNARPNDPGPDVAGADIP